MSTNLISASRPDRSFRGASRHFVRTPGTDHLLCWGFASALTVWIASNCFNASWINSLIETIIMIVAAGTMVRSAWFKVGSRLSLPVLAVFLLPVVGVAQLLLGRAAYGYATLLSTMDWFGFAALVYLGSEVVTTRERLAKFFQAATLVGGTVTLLELYQLFVFGRYQVTITGLPLISSNFFAEFVELVLPAILFPVFRSSRTNWYAIAISALMVATVVGAGARMGSLLVVVEVLSVLLLSKRQSEQSPKSLNLSILAIGLFVVALAAVEGAGTLQAKMTEVRPLAHRSQFVTAAFSMIRTHPVAGWGLGSFPVVYPQFEEFESEYFINHVHNDYAEMAVDGGIIFVVLWLGLLCLSLKAVFQRPWLLGCLALTVHSFSDFPIFRPQIAGLFAFLLGAGIATRSHQKRLRAANHPFPTGLSV